jgi:hypothetical protein
VLKARFFVYSLLALLALVPSAHAQSFGKNKVHYEQLQWSVLETPHLRLHFYAQEESLARSLSAFAESVTVEYDQRFRLAPKSKVPLLLYSTHHLFQQTNATPEELTESVGGLTELIKGRVLIPHNGSWARLRWVTRHELAHWYMLNKITAVMKAHKRSVNWLPDLWFTEGFAEYMGTTWDADAEGLLRDMVLTRNAYPLTESEPITGSVEMYKEGQSFLLWLAARYGDARIFDLLESVYRGDDFSTVFQITFGRKLVDLDHEWFEGLQRRYYPRGGHGHTRARGGATVAAGEPLQPRAARVAAAVEGGHGAALLLVRGQRGLGGPDDQRARARLAPPLAARAARRRERGVRVVPPVPEPARNVRVRPDRGHREARRARRALPHRPPRPTAY